MNYYRDFTESNMSNGFTTHKVLESYGHNLDSEWAGAHSPVTPAPLRNFHTALGQGVLVRLPSEVRYESEAEVVGQDTRQQVDSTRIPFRWICSLKVRFRDTDTFNAVDFDAGTGLLISPRHVLTAAHNVYAEITGSKGTKAKRRALLVWASPGRTGDSFPFGKVESESIAYLSKFEGNLDVRWDYALIKLKKAIGDQTFKSLANQPLGYWGSKRWASGTIIQPLSREYLRGQVVNVGGYPKNRNHTQWIAWDVIKDAPPKVQNKPVNELITYLTDTSEGQSGAPVWLSFPKSNRRYLVAVHQGSCHPDLDGCSGSPRSRPTSNMGVLITQEVVDQIEAWKKTM
jgi:V8-like Glu-specific endopeptidase